MVDAEKRRFMVLRESGSGYYLTWQLLRGGHVDTVAEAAKVEAEWQKVKRKRPRATAIIETVGKPFTTVADSPKTEAFMTIPLREIP